MTTSEDLDAIHRIIVVLIVQKYTLFYGDFFSGITNID